MNSINAQLAAVIVTYNRKAKLTKVLSAIFAQTETPDRVFVIDNASTDGTDELLKDYPDPRLQHVRLPENIGGAGGFHEGVRVAYEEGYDYIWLSDDDAYPRPDAIARLRRGLEGFHGKHGRAAPFACSMVRWTDGSLCEMNTPATVWDWPRFYNAEQRMFLVRSCSFVSMLIPRWAVQKHGYPIADYFIWYDDAEYSQRLARSHPGLFVADSVVIHDIPANKGVNYGLINDDSIWKFRYGARNETSFRWRTGGWFAVLEFVRQVWIQMSRGKVARRHRREIWRAVLRGLSFNPRIVVPKTATRGKSRD